ncbi:MAG: hypothetical protein ACREKE_01670, partial [bacterium]
MARAVSSSGAALGPRSTFALALLLFGFFLATPLHADYQAEEQAQLQRRLDENLWQVVFGDRVVT